MDSQVSQFAPKDIFQLFQIWNKHSLYVFIFYIPGLERKLKDPDDLFDLPADMSCNTISCKMEKALIGNVDKYQAPSDIQDTPRSSGGKSNNYYSDDNTGIYTNHRNFFITKSTYLLVSLCLFLH